MARHRRTLERVLSGTADAGIRFEDVRRMLLRLGFAERVRGSHHLYTHLIVTEALVLTLAGDQLKPYQVKAVRRILQTHGFAERRHE